MRVVACDTHTVSDLADAMPIAWPSLTDLARLLGIDRSTLSRLSSVRRQPTRQIGRERRMSPAAAIDVLVERGFDENTAAERVLGVVARRQSRVPAAAESVSPSGRPRRLPASSLFISPSRLVALKLPPASDPTELTDADLFAALDRRLNGRAVPLERYIYGDA
jgi:hypothetical protein